MAISREIRVAAPLADVSARWKHFIDWVLVGCSRMVCDELACLNAVDTGKVTFSPDGGEATRVVFTLEVPDDVSDARRTEVQHHIDHDLVAFKDYIERPETSGGATPTKPDSENAAAFWRHQFPG